MQVILERSTAGGDADNAQHSAVDAQILPKISIVTPSFNQHHFIEKTICSVLDQRYPNLEYIVIDGGSTDGSKQVIEKHAHELHYWVSESDRGHAHALNKGFSRSTGEIMAWLNSDDLYTPWALRTVAEVFAQNPDVDWIVGLNGWWNSAGQNTGVDAVYFNQWDYLTGRFAWIQQESVFWRRRLWERTGAYIDESYRLSVDTELWCRFFGYAELHHVSSLLGGYRVHGNNRATKHMPEVLLESRRAVQTLVENSDRSTQLVANRIATIVRVGKLPLVGRYIRKLLCALPQYRCAMDTRYRTIEFDKSRWSVSERSFL